MNIRIDSEEVFFSSQSIKLAGTLYKPNGQPPYPAVVVVHPASAAERTDPFYEHLKSELPPHGIAVLVFDRRGSGASEGDFKTADFEDLAGDVLAAVDYLQLRSDIDRTRIGLHGTSQGTRRRFGIINACAILRLSSSISGHGEMTSIGLS